MFEAAFILTVLIPPWLPFTVGWTAAFILWPRGADAAPPPEPTGDPADVGDVPPGRLTNGVGVLLLFFLGTASLVLLPATVLAGIGLIDPIAAAESEPVLRKIAGVMVIPSAWLGGLGVIITFVIGMLQALDAGRPRTAGLAFVVCAVAIYGAIYSMAVLYDGAWDRLVPHPI